MFCKFNADHSYLITIYTAGRKLDTLKSTGKQGDGKDGQLHKSITCTRTFLPRLGGIRGTSSQALLLYICKNWLSILRLVNCSLNITDIKPALEMCEPCMPAAFLLAACNFKGFPALKPRQVPWAALKPAFPGLLILNMALPTSQAICFQSEIILKIYSY